MRSHLAVLLVLASPVAHAQHKEPAYYDARNVPHGAVIRHVLSETQIP